ncbi:hypothetical protein HAPAU_18090 [Halalkalicoccus paucihalophilus]|uniref:DUF7344 domain-containing protein n=1 Tax=Halalkalicoccus paucihalophilus TaxID=1008153 RepID=A0A151AGB6_9EURY|nr:hypothetical protein [Halalkalicoccus paucihalophilus]KYH26708.1 hypothetical protein HAPAU_18090 [Halalkalicoccus paucihalophilus]
MSEEPSVLEEGDIHDILRNDRRRAVIEFLLEHNERATIRELSEHIAALESGEDPPPRNIRQSVYVSLHQTHLPKLEGLGVVSYDTDSKDVELRERAGHVEAYMDQTHETSDRFPLVYVAIGILGALLTIGSFVAGSVAELWIWVLPLFVIIAALGGYQLWGR